MERDAAEIQHVADLVLGVLHGQHVVVAALRIDPVARRDHLVRGQRGDDVVDHLALIEPELAGALAVDVERSDG